MPIFEYRCNECGNKFSLLVQFSDLDKEQTCPACKSSDIEKEISSFSSTNPSGSSCSHSFSRSPFS